MNVNRGTASRTSQVPDLSGPPIIKRDTFEDILTDAEVLVTPQRQVRFAKGTTSMPIVFGRPADFHVEWIQLIDASQVPNYEHGPLIHLDQQNENLFQKDFGHSLQVAAMEFKKLRELKVTKLKGGYSSNASLMFQLWLKDIWMCVLEHHLPSEKPSSG